MRQCKHFIIIMDVFPFKILVITADSVSVSLFFSKYHTKSINSTWLFSISCDASTQLRITAILQEALLDPFRVLFMIQSHNLRYNAIRFGYGQGKNVDQTNGHNEQPCFSNEHCVSYLIIFEELWIYHYIQYPSYNLYHRSKCFNRHGL